MCLLPACFLPAFSLVPAAALQGLAAQRDELQARHAAKAEELAAAAARLSALQKQLQVRWGLCPAMHASTQAAGASARLVACSLLTCVQEGACL